MFNDEYTRKRVVDFINFWTIFEVGCEILNVGFMANIFGLATNEICVIFKDKGEQWITDEIGRERDSLPESM